MILNGTSPTRQNRDRARITIEPSGTSRVNEGTIHEDHIYSILRKIYRTIIFTFLDGSLSLQVLRRLAKTPAARHPPFTKSHFVGPRVDMGFGTGYQIQAKINVVA